MLTELLRPGGLSILKHSFLVLLGRQRPYEGEHFYHLRVARELIKNGRRSKRDDKCWFPAGIRADDYPPVLQYVLAGVLVLFHRAGIRDQDIRISTFLVFFLLGVTVTATVHLFDGGVWFVTALIFFTTPVVLGRICSLRGELLCIAALPLLIMLCGRPDSWPHVLSIPILLAVMGFSSRTSAYIFLCVALWLLNCVGTFGILPLVSFVGVLVSWTVCVLWYGARQRKFYSFRELLWLRKSLRSGRKSLLLDNDNGRVISAEERHQSIIMACLSAPCVLTAAVCIPYASSPAQQFATLFLSISFLYGLASRRYIIYAVVPAMILLPVFPDSLFYYQAILVITANIIVSMRCKVFGSDEVIGAINVIKESCGNRSSLVLAPWNMGHFISGYGEMYSFWSSKFPSAQRFKVQEALFEKILTGKISIDKLFGKLDRVYIIVESSCRDRVHEGFNRVGVYGRYTVLALPLCNSG